MHERPPEVHRSGFCPHSRSLSFLISNANTTPFLPSDDCSACSVPVSSAAHPPDLQTLDFFFSFSFSFSCCRCRSPDEHYISRDPENGRSFKGRRTHCGDQRQRTLPDGDSPHKASKWRRRRGQKKEPEGGKRREPLPGGF